MQRSNVVVLAPGHSVWATKDALHTAYTLVLYGEVVSHYVSTSEVSLSSGPVRATSRRSLTLAKSRIPERVVVQDSSRGRS